MLQARRDDPDLDKVWGWFQFQRALIGEELGSIRRESQAAGGDSVVHARRHRLQFIGKTQRELDEFFEEQQDALGLLTMLDLLVTTEAILRVDFEARVAARKKDNLSKTFREIDKTRKEKVRLNEDILAAMGENGVRVSELRGMLRLRDWLAHGRHWHPKLGRDYTPEYVFDVAKALIQSIPVW